MTVDAPPGQRVYESSLYGLAGGGRWRPDRVPRPSVVAAPNAAVNHCEARCGVAGRTGTVWHSAAMTVVGVDGCKRGWIAITLDHTSRTRGYFVEQLDGLLDRVPDAGRCDRHPHRTAVHRPAASRRRGPRPAGSATQLRVLRTRTPGHHRRDTRRSQRHLQADHRPWAQPAIVRARAQDPRGRTVGSFGADPRLGGSPRCPSRSCSAVRRRRRRPPGLDYSSGTTPSNRPVSYSMTSARPARRRAPMTCSTPPSPRGAPHVLHRGDGISLPDPPETASDSSNLIAIWA